MTKSSIEERVPRSDKVAFILSQPPEVRAREVVARALEQGMLITEQRVYAVRFIAKNQGPPRRTKADFVLRQPDELSAREVVERGKSSGIELRESQVHNIRWAARRQQRAAAAGLGAPAVEAAPRREGPGRPRSATLPLRAALGIAERELRRCMGEVGLRRTRELLDEVDRTFAG